MGLRRRHRAVVTLRHQDDIAVLGQEDLVELFIRTVVALEGKAVWPVEAEVVSLFQVRRTVETVVTMRWPPAPTAPPRHHFVQDQPFGWQWSGQHMAHLPQSGTAASHLGLHLVRFDQPDRVPAFGRRAANRERRLTFGGDREISPGGTYRTWGGSEKTSFRSS